MYDCVGRWRMYELAEIEDQGERYQIRTPMEESKKIPEVIFRTIMPIFWTMLLDDFEMVQSGNECRRSKRRA